MLEFYDKFFINDIGIRNGLIGYKDGDINGLLENVVYNEMKFRGYVLSVGVFNGREIDFVAEKQNDVKYIQVSYLLGGKGVVEREFGNLKKIKIIMRKSLFPWISFFRKTAMV